MPNTVQTPPVKKRNITPKVPISVTNPDHVTLLNTLLIYRGIPRTNAEPITTEIYAAHFFRQTLNTVISQIATYEYKILKIRWARIAAKYGIDVAAKRETVYEKRKTRTHL